MRGKLEGASARAEDRAGQATANAASVARAARLRRGEGITTRRLHLAEGALGAAALSRMDCLRPARNNRPDWICPTDVEGRDKGSIVTPNGFRSVRIENRAPTSAFDAFSGATVPASTRIHRGSHPSHIGVIRSAATLGRNAGDVLVRIIDVKGFAVDEVMRIDQEER